MILHRSYVLTVVCVALGLVACAAPAHAGFELVAIGQALTFALLEAAIGVPAALALTPFVFTAAVVGAAYGLSVLLAPSLGDVGGGSVDPGRAKDTFESSESPELRAIGRVRLGGLKAFGNTNAANRYRLVLHCKGPIDGIEEYYLGGREVTVDPDGSVTSPPWSKLSGSWAYVDSKSGDGTETAWTALLTDFSDIWTSDHRARGISQSLVKYVNPGLTDAKFLKLYQGGPPDLEVVKRAENNVYDSRIDDTTWAENGILNAYHILLSYPEFSINDIDTDFMSSEADRADALIETLDGDVARSRAWGVWSSETARGTNMQKVLDSIGARIVPRDGGEKIGIELIDDVPTAEVSIELRHIVGLDWRSGPEGVERPNVCRVRYYSPERNYELTEIDMTGIAWARIEDEITAYGEKIFDVELPFCPNSGQAQRRARQMFSLARADTGVARTNMAGLAVWGARMVEFEFPDDLGTLLTLIAAPRVIDDQGQVEIPFVIWPTLTTWDPEVDEAPAPDPIPDLAYGSPLTVPAAPTGGTVVTYGGANGSATRIAYTIPIDAPSIEASYRTYTAGLPNAWTSMIENIAYDGYTFAHVALNLSGTDLDFRVRTYDGDDTVSIWSDILHVTGAVNNTAPASPSLKLVYSITDNVHVVVVAPDSLNVAYLSLSGEDAPTNQKITPGEKVEWDATMASGDFSYSAIARSTNGTGSNEVTAACDRDEGAAGMFLSITPNSASQVTIAWDVGAAAGSPTGMTGTSAPSGILARGNSGSWVASGLTSGTHTFTFRLYDVDGSTPLYPAMSVSIIIP